MRGATAHWCSTAPGSTVFAIAALASLAAALVALDRKTGAVRWKRDRFSKDAPYATPIVYPSWVVPEHLSWLVRLNPFHWFLELLRAGVTCASPMSTTCSPTNAYGVPLLRASVSQLAANPGTALRTAHWGMYASAETSQGTQYNDDVVIWSLAAPLTDLETEPDCWLGL